MRRRVRKDYMNDFDYTEYSTVKKYLKRFIRILFRILIDLNIAILMILFNILRKTFHSIWIKFGGKPNGFRDYIKRVLEEE